MRIPPGVRSRLSSLKLPTASLCAIAGLVIAWPSGLFPGNLVPIPDSIASAVAGPITKLTAMGSVFLLETLGLFFPLQNGVLQVGNSSIDLASSSGGLRILLAVMATSTAAAALASRPVWERLFIIASGLPIAIACGVVRVTLGCLLIHSDGLWLANIVLIEVAGWLTLSLAWCCLLTERSLLSRILVPPPAREVVPVLIGKQSATDSQLVAARRVTSAECAGRSTRSVSLNRESSLTEDIEEAPRQRLALLVATS